MLPSSRFGFQLRCMHSFFFLNTRLSLSFCVPTVGIPPPTPPVLPCFPASGTLSLPVSECWIASTHTLQALHALENRCCCCSSYFLVMLSFQSSIRDHAHALLLSRVLVLPDLSALLPSPCPLCPCQEASVSAGPSAPTLEPRILPALACRSLDVSLLLLTVL